MQRISSNLTLFYKFFIPTFVWTILGAFTVVVLNLAAVKTTTRLLVLGIFLGMVALLYFTVLRLKRVEIDEEYLYVTNYFKHVRYPLQNVEKIVERDFIIIRTATVHLHRAGSFGKTMTFIPSGSLFNNFWKEHPELRVELLRRK
jgi:hypothetical protein